MKTVLISLMVFAEASLVTGAAYVWNVRTEYGAPGEYDSTAPYGAWVDTSTQENSVFVGQYRLSYGGSSIPAYCLQITEVLNTPTTYNYYVDALSEPSHYGGSGMQQADYLYATYGSSAVPLAPLGEPTGLSPYMLAAALQGAIWTSLYGREGFNVNAPPVGDTTSQQAVIYRLFEEYLTAAQAANQFYGSSWWQADSTSSVQALIGSPVPVPEWKYFGLISALFLAGLIGWELRPRERSALPHPSF